METNDEDPQLKLEKQIDELFEKADAMVFFVLNQLVEVIRTQEPTDRDR